MSDLEPFVELPTEQCPQPAISDILIQFTKVVAEECSDECKEQVFQALRLSQGNLTDREFN